MQYHHRSRLPPPPPPPFGRGGGAAHPRGHKQLYAPPPPRSPLPAPPPPPQRRYEVLMEAGRLAAEYLVSTGVLPPSSLQRGGGAWAAPPPPPPPPQQQQEPPAFYGRKRYEDVHSNNHSTRPRRNNGTSSSSSNRDDYSNGGSYNGRGKRRYGEHRRGHSDWLREREKERGRSSSNGRRYEEDEDEAPGFRRDRRGSGGNDEARSCVMEEVREVTPLMAKAVVELEMDDTRLKAVSSTGDIRKDADAPPEVCGENEEGEMKEDKVLSSELGVVEQGMDANGDVNKASTDVVMEAEAKLLLPDDKVVDEKAEDNDKVLCETSLNPIALDDEATNLENDLHVDRRNLLKHCDLAKAPTKPRSVRAHRNAASVQKETAVTETVDHVSSREPSQMVVDEVANERSLTNIQSDNRDQIYQESTGSSTCCNEMMEPMLLQDYKTSVVTENMTEDKNDAQLHGVQEYNEETGVSPLTTSQKDNLMQETNLSPLADSHKDSLIEETNLSSLTDSHKDSLIEEANISPLTDSDKDSLIAETDLSPLTDLHKDSLIKETDPSPLTASYQDSLMQETDLPRTMSLHENNLNLQFKEGTQICDIEMLPQDVDLIELSDQREIVGAELFSTVGDETIIKMEEEKLDQSRSFKICDISLVGDTKGAATHNNRGLGQCSAEESSAEAQKLPREDFVASTGDNVSGTDDLSQLSSDNKAVQVIDIEDDTPIEIAGFDSSKAKNEMICSSMDNMMHPGIHTDDLPIIQDGYNIAISDYLGADIPCYTSMQPDLQAGICTNDPEGIPVMDDPIYGSLTDIGFMDVWGQPAQDFEKFF